MPDVACRIPDARCRMSEARGQMPDAACWTWDQEFEVWRVESRASSQECIGHGGGRGWLWVWVWVWGWGWGWIGWSGEAEGGRGRGSRRGEEEGMRVWAAVAEMQEPEQAKASLSARMRGDWGKGSGQTEEA
jgi:hypothetical protein